MPNATVNRKFAEKTGLALAVFAGVCLASAARAENEAAPISISGFGTLGATYHEREGAEFRRDVSQPDGVKSGQLGFSPDTMLGMQLTARPSEQFEATVQAVSRHAIDVNYRPQISWAYLKFKPSAEVSLRAGRLGIEMYLQGDSADIGYANLPIRQPVIFYPRAHDGIDAEVARPLGAGTLRLKGMFGQASGKLRANGAAAYESAGRLRAALAEYTWSGWTGRISAGKLTLDNELSGSNFQTLANALAQAPNGAEIMAAISMRKRTLDFLSLAVAYDAGPLQAIAGLSQIRSERWADQYSFHIQGGYRLGKFTPYVLYSAHRADRGTMATGIPWGLSTNTDMLNQMAGLAQGGIKTNESDFGIGMRYDTSPNTALKFQIDRIRYRDPKSIVDPSLDSQPYEQRKTRQMSLFSIALEFVF
jgi:hypothetical protein